jgi:hypothetical protein
MLARKSIAADDELFPGLVTGPTQALRAGERCCASLSVDDKELPVLAARVVREEFGYNLLRGQSLVQEAEAIDSEEWIAKRLAGDRAGGCFH